MRGRRKSGFTLIEILVVVSIIGVIAALAIPSLLRSKIAANETSAIKSMQVIAEGEEEYKLGEGGVYGTLAEMSATNPPVINAQLGNGTKSGYLFVLTPDTSMVFTCRGEPRVVNETGNRFFYVDSSQVIHHRVGASADETDPVIDG